MGPEITNEDSFNEPRKRVKNLRIYCDSKVIPSHKWLKGMLDLIFILHYYPWNHLHHIIILFL